MRLDFLSIFEEQSVQFMTLNVLTFKTFKEFKNLIYILCSMNKQNTFFFLEYPVYFFKNLNVLTKVYFA